MPPPKPKPKINLVAQAARQRLEAVKKIETDLAQKEAEEEAKRLEEERREEEEKRKVIEVKQTKKDARSAKIAELKASGQFMSRAEREKRAHAEDMRRQFESLGLINPDSHAAPRPQPADRKPPVVSIPVQEPASGAEADDSLEDWELELGASGSPAKEKVNANKGESTAERVSVVKEEIPSYSETDKEASSSNAGRELRCPIVCVMGHVDTGKTKLLDRLRNTNVQGGEAGGITQQIGATYYPGSSIEAQVSKLVSKSMDVRLPGILFIDTPGHESFVNLRQRGSSLCDIAILVVDLMHGLESRTLESIEILRSKKCPFVIALNKVDRLYQWKANAGAGKVPMKDMLKLQKDATRSEFDDKWKDIKVQLAAKASLNSDLYWDVKDPRGFVSVVPISAMTGDGMSDLLFVLAKLTQTFLAAKVAKDNMSLFKCSTMEIREIDGYGTTVDVMLVNGVLRAGDKIVLGGRRQPIVTSVRTLLVPPPLIDVRVKCSYVSRDVAEGCAGVKICAAGLEDAIAGSTVYKVVPGIKNVPGIVSDEATAVAELDKEMSSAMAQFTMSHDGVFVAASSLGSLEALLSFLQDNKVAVSHITIGDLTVNDVRKVSIMHERKRPDLAVILAFDVKISEDVKKEAATLNVKFFQANVIYNLCDQFLLHLKSLKEAGKSAVVSKNLAIFPGVCEIIPTAVFNKKSPMVFGVNVLEGSLRVGTPIAVPSKGDLLLGVITSIECDHKPVDKVLKGGNAAIKIESRSGASAGGDVTSGASSVTFGRHFDHTDKLYSKISRESIDCLKAHFREEMSNEDWLLVIELKKVFGIA